MAFTNLLIYAVLLSGSIWSFTTNKLTFWGAMAGALIGLMIYTGTGLSGFYMLLFFFVVASAATKWQRNKKDVMNAADVHTGRRTATQVLANGGVAALLALCAWIDAEHMPLAQLMIAGSFAAATADTLSSELGTVYGSRFYNILTFKREISGLDGVISLEGTLIGVAGAFAIATIFALCFGLDIRFLWIVMGGFMGNLLDSILGAWLERKGLIGNNTVNFLNTLAGALICWILLLLNC
jgi:uncharacterized protein (TIGR00297 family)